MYGDGGLLKRVPLDFTSAVTLRRRRPSRSQLATALLLTVPVVAGAAFVESRRAGLLVAVVAVGAAGLVRISRWPLPEVVIVAATISSAFVDLPRRVALGPVSGGAAVTALAAGAGVVTWILAYRGDVAFVTRPLLPLGLFVGWALTTCVYHHPTINGAQNVLVWIATLGVAGLTAAQVRRRPDSVKRIVPMFVFSCALSIALYAGSVALGGLGSASVIAPRAFALLGLVAVAAGLGLAKTGRRSGILLAAIASVFIVLSLSRLATGVAAVLWCVGGLNPSTFRGWFRFFVATSATLAVFIVAVTAITPLHDRFSQGDLTTVGGGLRVNTEGRLPLWEATWRSYLTSPIIGQGAGTADDFVTAHFSSGVGHPHEDYLRILHDYGAIGLILWLAAYFTLLKAVWRGWRDSLGNQSSPADWSHFAALLALTSVGLGMLTDNVMIYPFVMVPVGLLVGLSLGSEGGYDSGSMQAQVDR